MMTRKDYVKTAEILRNAIANSKGELKENSTELFFAIETTTEIAEQFAEYFAQDNPRFDENKFFEAIWKEN